MSYREVRIVLPSHEAEDLSDALMANGALSSAIEDAHAGTVDEEAIFGEPGEETGQLWSQSLVLTLFAEDADIPTLLQAACNDIGIKIPAYAEGTLPEQDWVRLTQTQFEPVRISSRLWVVPSWHQAPDETAINLKLDPGLAFGTGTHPTTRLCLQWLDQRLPENASVLDYGCGSGILAIAAVKLGAKAAYGIDIDPQAITASQSNAKDNCVSIPFALPDNAPKNTQYDVVLANILANPLRLLGDMLAAATRSGGYIVLSGILKTQEAEIVSIYSQWFDMDEPTHDDGWICLSGRKR